MAVTPESTGRRRGPAPPDLSEKGGNKNGVPQRSDDRRLTTHTVRQSWLPSFFMVPYNIGYHLSHHVDMGVPWRRLPQLHRELVAAGYVTPELEYPSYTALWRKLASRPS